MKRRRKGERTFKRDERRQQNIVKTSLSHEFTSQKIMQRISDEFPISILIGVFPRDILAVIQILS